MGYRQSSSFKYILVSIIAVLLIAAILLAAIVMDGQNVSIEWRGEEKILEFDGETYILKENVETFLVLGLDKYDENIISDSYNNNQQADFLMLMVFDHDAKTYSTIHINRDTMVEVDVLGVAGDVIGTQNKQIALSHTYGKGGSISNSNTAKAVSKLLCGVKIRHYMSLTLDSIPLMNELVGGVTLEVLDDFTGVEGVEGVEKLIKGETITLTPELAQLYVQHRKELEDSTNATRMERQRQYLEAMRVQIEEKIETDNEFLTQTVIKMADYMESDCSSTRLQEIGKKMQEYEFVQINDIKGESKVGKGGHMEFYPDENDLKRVVIDLFYVPKT